MAKSKDSFACGLGPRELIELDACTQCGECIKFCPVQDVTGRPSISPPEKIRMYKEFIRATDGLRAALFGPREVDRELLEEFSRAVFECTTCGACGEACTVGIFTQRLWPMLRREMVRRGLGPIGAQREIPGVVEKTGNPYNKSAAERFSPWLPEGLPLRDMAPLAYYAGCTGAYEAMPMVRGDALVLREIGGPFTMLPPEEEVCCGFPLFITGQFDLLEGLVKRLVEGYRSRGVKTLLCSCPCCVNMMSRDWPLFYGGPLPFRIMHMSQFAAAAIKYGRLSIKRELNERLIYHDPCYLSRGVGIIEEPRYILGEIPGAHLLEFARHGAESRCCGAGGAARKVFHENAIAIARLSIDEAAAKGADKLVLSCPACYSKVNEALQGHGKQIRIIDIMELVSELI